MSDIYKPKLDPALLESLKGLHKEPLEKPLNTIDFGHTTLLGSDSVRGDYEYIDIGSRNDPSFYENEIRRGTQMVDMDDLGQATASPDQEKRIATFGLAGCTAVAVAIEKANGTRTGYVQHYSPLNDSFGARMLGEAVKEKLTDVVSARAVVMTPGEYTQEPSAKWAMKPQNEALVGLLTVVAQQGLGEAVDVQVYPYSEQQRLDNYGQGTLMIEFKPGDETTILAETMAV